MRTSMVPLKIIIVLVSMLFLFPEIIISQRKACQLLNDGEFLWLSIVASTELAEEMSEYTKLCTDFWVDIRHSKRKFHYGTFWISIGIRPYRRSAASYLFCSLIRQFLLQQL